MAQFLHKGRTISYQDYGEGERPLVLVHGLLLNRHMFDRLAPAIAARGNRVLTIDLLGHGASDRPPEMVNYAMRFFGEQVVGLLDHLEIPKAVIGGTSLGANTTLTVARDAPERVKGMVVEMPVLDNALLAVAAFFTPMLLALRFGSPLMKGVAALANRVPAAIRWWTSGSTRCARTPSPRPRFSRVSSSAPRLRTTTSACGWRRRRWWSATARTRSTPSRTPGCSPPSSRTPG